eukprot:204595_1
MTGDSLRKDMSFLMNLSSKMHVASRESLLHSKEDRDTHDRFMSLCSAAKFKKIRLFLQPIGMAKHQNNKTYTTKTMQRDKNHKVIKTIHWTMSVQLGCHQLLLHDIHENDTLFSVLQSLKQRKFQTLTADTARTKIMHQNTVLDTNTNGESMEVEHKKDILDTYDNYLTDMEWIRLPQPAPKKRSNPRSSHAIARSVLETEVIARFWNSVKINEPIDEKDKASVILKIPNHFMYIRVNPMDKIVDLLKHKIINEYPEFIVVTPEEMKSDKYVIIDHLGHHQFGNCIKFNTKIHQQRKTLKTEMYHKLNEKKLFHRNNNNNNRYKKHKKYNNYNRKRFDERSNVNNRPPYGNRNSNQNDNGLKARDLFNGSIVNENNTNKRHLDHGYQPAMKKIKYQQNQNKPTTFNNPFNLTNTNPQQQQNNNNNW